MLRLQASDGELTSDDSVTLTVGGTSENSAPLVNAGPDATVYAYYRGKLATADEGDTNNPDDQRDDDGDGNKRKDRRMKPIREKDLLKELLKEYRKERVFVGATVVIHGTVTDDDSIAGVQAEWSKVSGPGPVQFGDFQNTETSVYSRSLGRTSYGLLPRTEYCRAATTW